MAIRDYFSAAYPEPWQIMGIRLRPFSLGHYIKLAQFKNAFVSEKTEVATFPDLIQGIAVCSMASHPDPMRDEFWQWWNQPAPYSIFAALCRKTPLTPAERDIVRWGRRVRKLDDWVEKAKMFAAYISTHSEPPGYWVTADDNKPGVKSGAHWVQSVISGLVSECGYTQIEALNVPVCKCLQDYLKAAENQGTIRLMPIDVLETTNGA